MNVFLFLKGEFQQCKSIFISLTLLLCLALCVACSVTQTERMLKQASIRAAEQFDILVGAKASRTGLLMGTVYLRDEMLGLCPMTSAQHWKDNPDVAWWAPLAFGDRIDHYTLVGTTRDFVTLGGQRELASGRIFMHANEVVVGANTPFYIGQKVKPTHGRAGDGHQHDHTFVVTGVLPETGTPWDNAVLMPIEAIWQMHSHAQEDAHDDAHEHDHPLETWLNHDLSEVPGTSAFVITPKSIAGAYKIRQTLLQASADDAHGRSVNLMALFTGEALIELFSNVNTASFALKTFAASSVAISLLAALLTGFVLARLREPQLKRLRMLGAPRRYIMTSVWVSVTLSVVLASIGALIGATALTEIAAYFITQNTSIVMHANLAMPEVYILLLTVIIGATFALIPAWLMGKRNLI